MGASAVARQSPDPSSEREALPVAGPLLKHFAELDELHTLKLMNDVALAFKDATEGSVSNGLAPVAASYANDMVAPQVASFMVHAAALGFDRLVQAQFALPVIPTELQINLPECNGPVVLKEDSDSYVASAQAFLVKDAAGNLVGLWRTVDAATPNGCVIALDRKLTSVDFGC